MKTKKRDPILVMYNALMAVSFIAGESPTAIYTLQIRNIADSALMEMNSDHTKLIQDKVFGFGELDKPRKRKR